ncbi:PDZ domain-containing protein [Bdellovibrio bacteriovorus]|uniref:PDZ domain-containing protein n=1 Tax=Bdellovibrio bacteriovorus TaxID=959 RepID=UPI0021CECC12|nr:PDZ domain-containing protein [Bdellovibrio bacteriovorus]UXR63567.1 PDZ domain-containing protein [Bdellovibrio bacteriovorus]
MLRLLISLMLLLSLAACQSANLKKPEAEIPQTEGAIPSGGRWVEGAMVSGRSAFVEVDNKSSSTTEEALLKDLKKKIENQLVDVGFKLVSEKVAAHVFVRVSYSEVSFDTAFPTVGLGSAETTLPLESGTVSVKRNVQVLVDGTSYSLRAEGDQKVGDFYLAVYAQNYGDRPTDIYWSRQRGLAGTQALLGAIQDFTKNWLAGLGTLRDRVQEQKQAGLPGCIPRLGFAVEPVAMKGQLYYLVTAVDKKSPAEKAGMRTGDFVLEVDSHSYGEFSKKPEFNKTTYKDLKKVPLKLLRGEKEVLSQIQAQMACQ